MSQAATDKGGKISAMDLDPQAPPFMPLFKKPAAMSTPHRKGARSKRRAENPEDEEDDDEGEGEEVGSMDSHPVD